LPEKEIFKDIPAPLPNPRETVNKCGKRCPLKPRVLKHDYAPLIKPLGSCPEDWCTSEVGV
jgi:hypothetical protein